MVCLRDLVEESPTWKYVTYITGSEKMMITNRELVKYLIGSNGTVFQRSHGIGHFTHWVANKWVFDKDKAYNPEKPSKTTK